MQKLSVFLCSVILLGALAPVVRAETDVAVEHNLTRCLRQAQQAPDAGLAEAENWLKRGGGDFARQCRAFAQFYRGEYASSAREFMMLAAMQNAGDRRRQMSLYAQAGLAYMRAGDQKNAETAYAAALKLESQDPELWIDRAMERLSFEHYWEAIDDLNRALEIMPDTSEALRLRGQAYVKLGQTTKALEDLERAEILDEADDKLERAKGQKTKR